jgi:hypothetical protein
MGLLTFFPFFFFYLTHFIERIVFQHTISHTFTRPSLWTVYPICHLGYSAFIDRENQTEHVNLLLQHSRGKKLLVASCPPELNNLSIHGMLVHRTNTTIARIVPQGRFCGSSQLSRTTEASPWRNMVSQFFLPCPY